MKIQPIIMVLADISGYTRFIRYHRVSLIHAEKIITELLESVIASSSTPLILHELEGDAVTFYAIDDGNTSCGREVFRQVQSFFTAFRKREGELISECSLCECDACNLVGQLKIKVVIHKGEAVFIRLRQFTKIAGEDVILAHRLLKNSVPSNEYILMTEPFIEATPSLKELPLEPRTEQIKGLDNIPVYVLSFNQMSPVEKIGRSLLNKIIMTIKNEVYLVKRLLVRSRKKYKSLQDV